MPQELFEVMRRQRLLRDEHHPDCRFVFFYRGEQIKDFYAAWRAATRKAGMAGKIFYDLRRTAVRNMVRRGIPDAVAMRISGHKTRSVFERYNLVNQADLKSAAAKMSAPRTGRRRNSTPN